MKLTFLGGAEETNRSCFLLETESARILVECGFNKDGDTELSKYPINIPKLAATIDAVFLTHGHIDHCGAIPYLIEHGFYGPIYASAPTKRLVQFMWQEWERVLQPDLSYPMDHYVEKVKWVELPVYGRSIWYDISHLKLSFQYGRAGHTLGSVWFMFASEGKTIFFSGDYQITSPQLTFDYPPVKYIDTAVIDGAYGKQTEDSFLRVRHGKGILTAGKKLGIVTMPHGKGLSLLLELEKQSVFSGENVYLSRVYRQALKHCLVEDEWWTKDAYRLGERLWKRQVNHWKEATVIAGTNREFIEQKKNDEDLSVAELETISTYPVHPFFDETTSLVEHLHPSLLCIVHADKITSRTLAEHIEKNNQWTISPVAGEQVKVEAKEVLSQKKS